MTNETCPNCGSKEFTIGNDLKRTRYCGSCRYVWITDEQRIKDLNKTIFVRENDLKIAINYLKDYAKMTWPINKKARKALDILWYPMAIKAPGILGEPVEAKRFDILHIISLSIFAAFILFMIFQVAGCNDFWLDVYRG